jgi:hypothetical protein
MEEFQLDLSEVLQRAAQVYQSRIDLQVPVKSGKLKAGVKVLVENDTLVLSSEEDYGVYTDYGTGDFNPDHIFEGGWDPGQFVGYKEGKGGIQAQKWSSVPIDTVEEVDLMIEEEIDRQIQEFIDKLNTI